MGFHVSLGECTCSRGEGIPATPKWHDNLCGSVFPGSITLPYSKGFRSGVQDVALKE